MTMAESFDRLRESSILSDHLSTQIKKSVEFRNIAVHDYCPIDRDIVYAVCTNHLDDFRDFTREIMKGVQAPSLSSPLQPPRSGGMLS
ncbi:MAG: DUF86 domain-containing protein [Desulfoplanes sp.]